MEIEFVQGDCLVISYLFQLPGRGLSYPNMVVITEDEGRSGGWDVYDGVDSKTGKEVSFYGFSVLRKGRK